MVTVLWDAKPVLLVDLLECGTTVNSEGPYKRSALITDFQGHFLCATMLSLSLLQKFTFNVFNHQPYSPDVALHDYQLFMHLKKWLGSLRYDDDDELKDAFTGWLKAQAAEIFEEGISKLIKRYNKCLTLNGNYVIM